MSSIGIAFVLTISGCFSVDAETQCRSQEFEYEFTTPGACLGMRDVLLDAFQYHPSFKINTELTRCSVVARELVLYKDKSSAISAGTEWLEAFPRAAEFGGDLNGSVMDLIEKREKLKGEKSADDH